MKLPTLCLVLAALSGLLHAEGYRAVAVSDLRFDGLPEAKVAALCEIYLPPNRRDSLTLHLPVEAYLSFDDDELRQGDAKIVYRVGREAPVSGSITLFDDQMQSTMAGLKIGIPADKGEASTEEAFVAARKAWAERLASRHYPGAAWFRHVAGKPDPDEDRAERAGDLEDTFDLFGGGRAISENLALDRELMLAGSADEQVRESRLSEIPGVTVKAIDWKSRLPQGEIVVDALAASLPADQHALFAPSLPGLLDLLKRIDGDWMPLLQSASVRNPYRSAIGRYRRQLGLDFPDLTARLLPVRGVAITGGDPYFATGTDVALLMESDQPELLYQALATAIGTHTPADGPESAAGDAKQLSFTSDDGKISSHLLRVGGLVAVCNSAVQVRRLLAVAAGKAEALGATDEFRFFRSRYPLAEKESAFVFLSDATIRRWAGPELRIGASRRNRALAALNELSARGISGREEGDDYSPLLGRVQLLDGMAHSEWYGSADFLTPISELGIESVTSQEKEAYLAWRRGYESGWAKVFDPIAIRLKLADDHAAVDLTVMPLRGDSSYRQVIDLAGKAELPVAARLRHAASALQLAMAIDPKGRLIQEAEAGLSRTFEDLKVSPLSWLGDSVSLVFEHSLFWQGGETRLDESVLQAPVCLRVAVKNRVHLGLVITALRAELEKSMPDILRWTAHEEDGQPYVVVSQADREDFEPSFQLCYAILPEALLVTLDLHTLKKSIARERRVLDEAQLAKVPMAKSLMMDLDPRSFAAAVDKFGTDQAWSRARQSWRALPILNEWHRRFPEEDPAALHARHFGETIACPGGKGYRWNAEALTMESVAYGHPGAPREQGELLGLLDRLERVTAGIDFEGDGLRLRLQAGPAKDLPDEPSPAPGPLLAKAADLVPVKTGRVLHFRGKRGDSDLSWSEEIVSVEPAEHGLRFVTKEPWTDGDDSGVHHGTYQLAGDLLMTAWQDEGGFPSRSVCSVPRLVLPAELRVGPAVVRESRNQLDHEEAGQPVREDELRRTEVRVLGVESVETPAGSFKDCIKLEVHEETLTGDYFRQTLAWSWYQPGVGLVKSVGKMGELYEAVLERIVEPAK